jgi:uncharacterized membrane protein
MYSWWEYVLLFIFVLLLITAVNLLIDFLFYLGFWGVLSAIVVGALAIFGLIRTGREEL